MNLIIIVGILLWFAVAVVIMDNIADYIYDLTSWQQIIVGIVIIIGAPFMIITQAIEFILDCFLEKGWRDDDYGR